MIKLRADFQTFLLSIRYLEVINGPTRLSKPCWLKGITETAITNWTALDWVRTVKWLHLRLKYFSSCYRFNGTVCHRVAMAAVTGCKFFLCVHRPQTAAQEELSSVDLWSTFNKKIKFSGELMTKWEVFLHCSELLLSQKDDLQSE